MTGVNWLKARRDLLPRAVGVLPARPAGKPAAAKLGLYGLSAGEAFRSRGYVANGSQFHGADLIHPHYVLMSAQLRQAGGQLRSCSARWRTEGLMPPWGLVENVQGRPDRVLAADRVAERRVRVPGGVPPSARRPSPAERRLRRLAGLHPAGPGGRAVLPAAVAGHEGESQAWGLKSAPGARTAGRSALRCSPQLSIEYGLRTASTQSCSEALPRAVPGARRPRTVRGVDPREVQALATPSTTPTTQRAVRLRDRQRRQRVERLALLRGHGQVYAPPRGLRQRRQAAAAHPEPDRQHAVHPRLGATTRGSSASSPSSSRTWPARATC